MAVNNDLPLFSWRPECQLIPFPMGARIGKARHVAETWLSYSNEKEANGYARRIHADLIRHLEKIGVPAAQQKVLTDEFWKVARSEVTRLRYQRQEQTRRDEQA
jgi:hypothetical protein